MKPSRELDKLVAEKVFGYEASEAPNPLGRKDWFYKVEAGYIQVPEYSKNIAAAWLVVEKTNLLKWELALGKNSAGQWCVLYLDSMDNDHRCDLAAIGETAPHAICLAALKAREIVP